MKSRILRSAVIAAILILGLVGCGGVANQSEPAGALKAAIEATQSGGLTKLADYACAARKADIATLFGGESAGSLTALGIDPNEMFGAMKLEFKDVQTTEKSRTGDSAVVHLSGTMTVSIDPAKMREVMKKVMEAQNQPIDDATLDMAITAMTTQLGRSQVLDEDVTVVQEGGKWLVCS